MGVDLSRAAEKRRDSRNDHERILASRGLMIARMLALQCQDQWVECRDKGLGHAPPHKRMKPCEGGKINEKSPHLKRATGEAASTSPEGYGAAIPDFSLIDVVKLTVEVKDYRKGWGGYRGRPCRTRLILHLSMTQTMGILYETLRRKFDCWEMEVKFTNLERTLTHIRTTDTPEALRRAIADSERVLSNPATS